MKGQLFYKTINTDYILCINTSNSINTGSYRHSKQNAQSIGYYNNVKTKTTNIVQTKIGYKLGARNCKMYLDCFYATD